jgi:hypothetical protein
VIPDRSKSGYRGKEKPTDHTRTFPLPILAKENSIGWSGKDVVALPVFSRLSIMLAMYAHNWST